MADFSTPAALFIGFIIVQRIFELVLAQNNTRRLIAQGAREVGASHYPLIVGLHTAWIVSLVFYGLARPVSTAWLAIFVVLQLLRVWVIANLGRRWTTRIIVVEEPLVKTGPFAWFRHPNYMVVVAEIFVAPMVLGLVWVAVIFTVLNAAALAMRVSVEAKALESLRR